MDLTWGESGRGTNRITAVLDDCVIRENFDGTTSMQLKGWSVSTYDRKTEKWKQTWVDNQGSYLDFVGQFENGEMELSRKAVINDKPALQRMVFRNIEKNSLDWNWERSFDEGKTWETTWQIHYARKK